MANKSENLKKDFKKAVKKLEEQSVSPVENIKSNKQLEDTEKRIESIFITIAKKLHPNKKNRLTLGQKTADSLTKWAGSWVFILSFLGFIILWMAFNTYIWFKHLSGDPFDPYPYILLNLVLSCLAALQAPIILMSQNREAQRDRLRAEYDYLVNRKAEKEIREIKTQLDRIERKFNSKNNS